MRGTIWLGCGIGLIAFIITLVVALSGNVWLVSLKRAVYAFLFFFLLAFPIHWLVAKITETPRQNPANEPQGQENSSDRPTEELAHQAATQTSEEEEFTPLFPPRIQRVNPQHDPAAIASAIRQFTDE